MQLARQISIGCQVFAKGTPEPQRRLFPRSHLIQIFCHNDINVIDIPIAYPNQRCGGAKSISELIRFYHKKWNWVQSQQANFFEDTVLKVI